MFFRVRKQISYTFINTPSMSVPVNITFLLCGHETWKWKQASLLSENVKSKINIKFNILLSCWFVEQKKVQLILWLIASYFAFVFFVCSVCFSTKKKKITQNVKRMMTSCKLKCNCCWETVIRSAGEVLRWSTSVSGTESMPGTCRLLR